MRDALNRAIAALKNDRAPGVNNEAAIYQLEGLKESILAVAQLRARLALPTTMHACPSCGLGHSYRDEALWARVRTVLDDVLSPKEKK